MKLLAFSDLHRDLGQAAKLVEMSADADVVIGAGDFASVHEGLEETIAALSPIEKPTVLVPGNNETADALRGAAADWAAATVLHGEATTIDGVEFFGLGAGVPTTPWDWSFDLSEEEAAAMIAPAPEGAVFVLHSPPFGHCDGGDPDTHFGSKAELAAIEAKRPRLVVFGHIHEAWGCASSVGDVPLRNLGPSGTWIEV
jgi:Icc-related predicted phosphoesterase